MSDSQQTSWSNDPNAPNVSYPVYNYEKTYFAGIFIGSALYGTRKASLPTRPSIRAHIICLVYFRDHHRAILPVHGCTT